MRQEQLEMPVKLRKVDLVGVGLIATDTLIALPAYPRRRIKLEYSHASIMPGGQVANTVVACQTWGLITRYVGKLGDTMPPAFTARPSSAPAWRPTLSPFPVA